MKGIKKFYEGFYYKKFLLKNFLIKAYNSIYQHTTYHFLNVTKIHFLTLTIITVYHLPFIFLDINEKR